MQQQTKDSLSIGRNYDPLLLSKKVLIPAAIILEDISAHARAQVPKLKPAQPGLINIASYTSDTCLRAGMQDHYYVVSHSIHSLWISLCCVSLLHCLKGKPSSSLWTYPAYLTHHQCLGEGYINCTFVHMILSGKQLSYLSITLSQAISVHPACSSFEKMNLTCLINL